MGTKGVILTSGGRHFPLLCVTNGISDGQEEKERSSAIVEALRQEQSEVEEQQKEVIRQREAQLEAEKEQREALALQLQETKVIPPHAPTGPPPPRPPKHPLLLGPSLLTPHCWSPPLPLYSTSHHPSWYSSESAFPYPPPFPP